MPTALITGINGFTGRRLVAELQRAGFTVFGIGQEASTIDDTTTVKCDLTDRRLIMETVNRLCPDVAIHLAGIAFAAHDDVEMLYRTNIVGTRNLLEALCSCTSTARAVLLASSANIYGNADVELIDERVVAAPANDYAVSKLAMEYMARLWADKLPITIVRPFNYTGVGQSGNFLLPKIVDHFKRRAPVIELGNIDVVRDFSDVRTVVDCYRRLLQRDSIGKSGDVFNICSGVGHSLLEAIEMMREISGHSPEIRVNPAFVRANEVKKLVGSRQKLENAIGKIASIPLHETLRWMYKTP
jgi:GDP-6-deoxy-D-talose 4-dehydrogenase